MLANLSRRYTISFGLLLAVSMWALTGSKPFDHPRINPFLESLLQKIETFQDAQPEERVYVQTDKPFYKPGESIWFSAYMRNGADFKASDKSDVLRVELINPKGTVEQEYQLRVHDGATKGDFFLSEEAAGGLYKLKVYTNWQKNDPRPAIFEKELQVQAVVLPRLKMKLDFERKAYGAGAEVKAELDLHTNENQPLTHHDFRYVISLAGDVLETNSSKSDQAGAAKIAFSLPTDLSSNDGLLNVLIDYQGQTESISRSVPIVLNQVFLSFYPEGGDMVHGLPGRVAFRALDEFGKPADIKGVVVDEDGKEVADFSSYHQGMGAIDMIPTKWQSYSVRLTEPAGVTETFPLPDALPRGYGLSVKHVDENDITLQIHSSETETLSLVAVVRGKAYYATEVNVNPTGGQIRIPTSGFPIGVAKFTLFDSKGIERCERLAFVNRHKQLNVQISSNKERYQPREEVELTVAVTDDRGMPMPADLSLSVTDDQLLTFADDKSSNILSWMLLEGDLKGKVEEPHFYFDPTEEKAEIALDHLLMTAGWRRFSWQQIQDQQLPQQPYAADQTRISGTVTDWSGNVIADASVKAGTRITKTDSRGRYEFKQVEFNGQSITVSVDHPEYGRAEMPVSKYTNQLNLRVRILPQVSGVVKDQNGEPLIGVTILEKGTSRGVTTDMDGRYRFEPLGENARLVFSYLGFSSTEMPVSGTEKLDVTMMAEQVMLDEVVITGAVPIRESRVLGAAVQSVQAEALQGRVAGVRVNRSRARKKAKVPRAQRAKRAQPVADDMAAPVDAIKEVDEEFVMDMPGEAIPEPEPVMVEQQNKFVEEKNELRQAPAIGLEDQEGEEMLLANVADTVMMRGRKGPAINDFVFAEEEAKPVNMQDVRRQISYPKVARDAAIEGSVVARVLIDSKGNYKQHKIIHHAHPLLSKEVEKQIHSLKFSPAIQGGKAIDSWINIPFRFDLDENGIDGNDLAIEPVSRSGSGNQKASLYYRAREFAAPDYAGQDAPETRTDFRSTIYWNGHVKVDRTGKAKVRFYASDALTSFKVTAEGIGTDGSVGRGTQTFFSQLPFGLSTKIPASLVQQDTLMLPITLVNNTESVQHGQMTYALPEGLIPLKKLPSKIKLPTGKALTMFVPLLVHAAKGIGKIRIRFRSKGLSDGVEQEIEFAPKGFPASEAFSSEESTASFETDLSHAVPGSIDISLTAFPDVSGEILSGLEGMLREPHGCFEQTSSSTYPNLLVLDYLTETDQDKPQIRKRAHYLIEKGYNRLSSFESSGGGFEWFGGNPAHEGLTAYGLMEFVDMRRVYNGVDDAMIDRTAQWLFSRRDGKGGFKRNPRALHQFGLSDQPTMSLYITWALTEAGYIGGIRKEIDYAYETALNSGNPYQLGLAANALFNAQQDQRAMDCINKLLNLDTNDQGLYQPTGYSAPGSGGIALGIETSSLALLALMKADTPNRTVISELANKIRGRRSAYGTFGSTNSTVLALRALIRHASFAKQTDKSGRIEILVDGRVIAEESYEAGRTEPIVIRGLEQGLSLDTHRFEVRFPKQQNPLPYVLSVNWYNTLPQSQDACSVDLTTALQTREAQQGETVRLSATLSNKTNAGLPMTIAILGIPAGLSPQPWQLKEMTEKGVLDFYEVWDNELICYFRQMRPEEVKTLNFDLKADVTGNYSAPASRAYLYYTDEFKTWTEPLEVEIGE